jgi:hypothetical protein
VSRVQSPSVTPRGITWVSVVRTVPFLGPVLGPARLLVGAPARRRFTRDEQRSSGGPAGRTSVHTRSASAVAPACPRPRAAVDSERPSGRWHAWCSAGRHCAFLSLSCSRRWGSCSPRRASVAARRATTPVPTAPTRRSRTRRAARRRSTRASSTRLAPRWASGAGTRRTSTERNRGSATARSSSRAARSGRRRCPELLAPDPASPTARLRAGHNRPRSGNWGIPHINVPMKAPVSARRCSIRRESRTLGCAGAPRAMPRALRSDEYEPNLPRPATSSCGVCQPRRDAMPHRRELVWDARFEGRGFS